MTNIKVLTAIIGLVVLEAIALFKGIDGTMFTMVVALIAGLAGYSIQNVKGRIEK